MKKYKKIIITAAIILIIIILFVPFARTSNIAEGVWSCYHSLIGELTFYGDTNANTPNMSGIGISVFGFEIFNIDL